MTLSHTDPAKIDERAIRYLARREDDDHEPRGVAAVERTLRDLRLRQSEFVIGRARPAAVHRRKVVRTAARSRAGASEQRLLGRRRLRRESEMPVGLRRRHTAVLSTFWIISVLT